MKFRSLFLGTAAAFAVAGGAQAADLAVAAPGGLCGAGQIAVDGWCLTIKGFVRQDFTGGGGKSFAWSSKAGTTLIGTTGGTTISISFQSSSDDNLWTNDGFYASQDFGGGSVKIGKFGRPYDLGGSTTDDGLNNPNDPQQDTVLASMGAFWFAVSDPVNVNYDQGIPELSAGVTIPAGPATLKIAGVFVGLDTGDAWGVNVHASMPMGGATLVANAAYANGSRDLADATSDGLGLGGGVATWTALLAVGIPVGSVHTVNAGVSYLDYGGVTSFSYAVQLSSAWNSVWSSFIEADVDNDGDVAGHARIKASLNSG